MLILVLLLPQNQQKPLCFIPSEININQWTKVWSPRRNVVSRDLNQTQSHKLSRGSTLVRRNVVDVTTPTRLAPQVAMLSIFGMLFFKRQKKNEFGAEKMV